jgi:hypothetical protein
MRWFFVFIFLVGLSLTVFAEDEFLQKTGDVLLNRLQLNEQLQQNLDETLQKDPQLNRNSKSVFKAVLFSAIVPGAGQIYNQSYWKAAAFLAIEAAAWAVNISYNKKGNDKDAEFKRYADQNWSEYRYWSYVNYQVDIDEVTFPGYDPIPYDEDGMIIDDEYGERTWYLIDEGSYDADAIAYLREKEGQFPTGSGFTHHLPETKTQQYYEMIGKYPRQFGNAWYDADFNTYYQDFGQGKITPMNDLYATMRDDANQYYKTAGYGTMVILVNHLISALDAGFTAKKINRQNLQVTYQNRRYVDEYVNMFGINFSL